jgi:cell division protein FtsN
MSVERRASGSSRDMVTAPKTRLVQKQPHLLAYITPAEAALLKKNGGTGEMVNGIPAFPRGSVSKSKVDKAKAKTSTKSAPAPRNDRQPVAKSKPAPAPKERNDRQPVAKPAPAPKAPKDAGPSARKKLLQLPNSDAPKHRITCRQPRKKLRQLTVKALLILSLF